MCRVMCQEMGRETASSHWMWKWPRGLSLWFKISEATWLPLVQYGGRGVRAGIRYSHLTSALTILSTMVSSLSSLLHFTTPSKYCERCWSAWVTVISRLLYVFSAARFCNKVTQWIIFFHFNSHSWPTIVSLKQLGL